MMVSFVLMLIPILCSRVLSQVTHGSLRLAGIGHTWYQGRVEIFYDGKWGTICSRSFSQQEAQVVCRQLKITTEYYIASSQPVTDLRFGRGEVGATIEDVKCVGNEESILRCMLSFCFNVACSHANDVGVICIPSPPTNSLGNPQTTLRWVPPQPGLPTQNSLGMYNYGKCRDAEHKVRLVIDSHSKICCDSGIVEIFTNNEWVVVCDDFWERVDAQVICRALCYENPAQSLAGTVNFNTDFITEPIKVTNMSCTGSESSPFECRYSYSSNSCGRNEMAVAWCGKLQFQNIIEPPDLICKDNMIITNFTQSWQGFVAHSSVSAAWQTSSSCSLTSTDYNTYFTFSIPFDKCGTIRTFNRTHITYENAILYVPSPTGLITRVKTYIIYVKCEMDRTYYVEKPYKPTNVNVSLSASGNYTIHMTFFIDNFINAITIYPVKIVIGNWLNVQLTLITYEINLLLIVKTCYATPSSNRHDTAQWELFTNKCIIDETVCFYPNDHNTFGFGFQAFKFIGYSEVHIHCEAYVCPIEDPHPDCDRSCHQKQEHVTQGQIGKRRKRSVDRKIIYITSKPIIIYDPLEDEDGINDINLDHAKAAYSGNVSTVPPTKTTQSSMVDNILFASGESSKEGNKLGGKKYHGIQDTETETPINTFKDAHEELRTNADNDGDANENEQQHFGESHASNKQEEVEQNVDNDQASQRPSLVHDTVNKVTKEFGTATASIKELSAEELDAILKSTMYSHESNEIIGRTQQPRFEKLVESTASTIQLSFLPSVVVFMLSFAFLLNSLRM